MVFHYFICLFIHIFIVNKGYRFVVLNIIKLGFNFRQYAIEVIAYKILNKIKITIHIINIIMLLLLPFDVPVRVNPPAVFINPHVPMFLFS